MTGNGNYVKVTIVTAAQFFPVNPGKRNGEMFENSYITTTKPFISAAARKMTQYFFFFPS